LLLISLDPGGLQREYRDARRERPAADRKEKTMKTNREVRAALNQQKSLEAFLAAKAEFDTLVAELQQASADHFGADSERVFWEHVETLKDWNCRLRDMANAYYRRGEYAA
jgi:ATP-dependent protease HslVU (ClpYQ) peptidase subunit